MSTLAKCKGQACTSEIESSDLQDTPPCKRPLLIHPTNIHGSLDCDKYSCNMSNCNTTSPEHFSLTSPFHIFQPERNYTTSLTDREEFRRSSNILSKCNNVRTSLQPNDRKDSTHMSPSFNRRSETFKNINHVSNIFFII